MFTPKDFVVKDFALIRDFIQTTVLANIVAIKNNEVEICPVPLIWQDNGGEYGYLIGHVAKNNPIVHCLNTPCKVIFNHNGHYISPNWYPSKAQTHKEVPTWNYQSVQLFVKPTVYHDKETIKKIISDTTDFFEQQVSTQQMPAWSINDAPSEYIDAMCQALVGFKLKITDFEAKFKLSQNKSEENKSGVIKGLSQINTPNALEMRNLVKSTLQ